MALGLALYGWDRVQGVVPEAMPLPRSAGDDPTAVMAPDELVRLGVTTGNFAKQLPLEGW
jgi:hypothetical protein